MDWKIWLILLIALLGFLVYAKEIFDFIGNFLWNALFELRFFWLILFLGVFFFVLKPNGGVNKS